MKAIPAAVAAQQNSLARLHTEIFGSIPPPAGRQEQLEDSTESDAYIPVLPGANVSSERST